jgi:glutamyl-tRNA synthetase
MGTRQGFGALPPGTLKAMSVRVRFAPSPTGMLHVGALRDALFKFLFARGRAGANILRIEDTDRSRYNPESEQEFIETLDWTGINFDEGPHIGGPCSPYRQSERKEAGVYEPYIQQILASGHAYKAFETPEELKAMRDAQEQAKQNTGYFGGAWRDATPAQVAEAEAHGKPFVIRQRIPKGTTIGIEDAIRGHVEWDSGTVDDPVLIKADGMPTYHFASMVDDHLMGITHVMRGEEWLSSAPKHAALFDAFGWPRPVFVHLPVIVGSDGKKLSKRHGATRVLDYAAEGYLPAALKNFIALIGWSPGDDREVMSELELIASFDLSGLHASPGKFDIEKLQWINGMTIRAMDPERLVDALLAYVRNPYTAQFWTEFVDENTMPNKPAIRGEDVLRRLALISPAAGQDRNYLLAAVKEVQERVVTLADFGEALEFFLVEEPPLDPKAAEKWLTQSHVRELFEWILGRLAISHVETVEHYEAVLKGFQTHKGFDKLGPVVHPTRVALTGKTTGPGLFELMSVLGSGRIENRLRNALAKVA